MFFVGHWKTNGITKCSIQKSSEGSRFVNKFECELNLYNTNRTPTRFCKKLFFNFFKTVLMESFISIVRHIPRRLFGESTDLAMNTGAGEVKMTTFIKGEMQQYINRFWSCKRILICFNKEFTIPLRRTLKAGYTLSRPDSRFARYKMIKHNSDESNKPNDMRSKMVFRFLKHWKIDGLVVVHWLVIIRLNAFCI